MEFGDQLFDCDRSLSFHNERLTNGEFSESAGRNHNHLEFELSDKGSDRSRSFVAEEVSSKRDEVRKSIGPTPYHHLEFGGSEGILATGGPVKHVCPVGAGFAVDGAVEEERPSAFVDPSGACA